MKKGFFMVLAFIFCFTTDALCMDIDELVQVAAETKKGISEVFTAIDRDLSGTAKRLSVIGIKSDEARKVLGDLCQNHPYSVDCAVVDAAGKMIMVEPQAYKGFEGSDISSQAHIKSMLRKKKPVFSGVFSSVEGKKTIDFEYPVFSAEKEFLGSVSMLVDQEMLAENAIIPIVQGTPCKVWIMQKNGLIVYDLDRNQIGRNIFSDELYREFNVLVSFARTVANTKDGAGSYNFYASGLDDKTLVEKYAAWETASLYGNDWRIIAMEIDKPVPLPELHEKGKAPEQPKAGADVQ